jgi:hypothetical protein
VTTRSSTTGSTSTCSVWVTAEASTFSPDQTPSEIRGNYVFDLRRSAAGDPSCMIYLDEGSSGFLVRDNLTDRNEFFRNRNGEGNRWENNGTEGPLRLKGPLGSEGGAGLETRLSRPAPVSNSPSAGRFNATAGGDEAAGHLLTSTQQANQRGFLSALLSAAALSMASRKHR